MTMASSLPTETIFVVEDDLQVLSFCHGALGGGGVRGREHLGFG